MTALVLRQAFGGFQRKIESYPSSPSSSGLDHSENFAESSNLNNR
ncbi:hypothetical protein [Roseibium polysiphoniae]|nr:hypothetical protein [Roseibium polysiphoniae]